jgi:hypothetical protein
MASMAFAIKAHENVLFPVPYAENEDHPLIITNQRVVQRNQAGMVEMPTSEIHFVGRHTIRPRLPFGIVLAVASLSLLVFGLYQFFSVWGMQMASPLSLLSSNEAEPGADGEATPPPEGADADVNWPREVLKTRAIGALGLVGALLAALGARALIRKQRFYVICRAGKRLLRIEAPTGILQTQIMVTVSAVKGKSLG